MTVIRSDNDFSHISRREIILRFMTKQSNKCQSVQSLIIGNPLILIAALVIISVITEYMFSVLNQSTMSTRRLFNLHHAEHPHSWTNAWRTVPRLWIRSAEVRG